MCLFRSRARWASWRKSLGLAELLNDESDDASVRIADQVLDEILHAVRGFIAGGDGIAEPNGVMAHVHGDDGGEGSALGDDGDAGRLAARLGRRDDEGEGNGIDVVDHAEAVGAFNKDAVLAGKRREFLLRVAAGIATLCKTSGKDDEAADLLARAGAGRVEYCVGGDGEHRAVDAVRQFV